MKIPSDKTLLYAMPNSYLIDGEGDISNPLGMNGIKLEAKSHLIHCSKNTKNNIKKCIKVSSSGIGIRKYFIRFFLHFQDFIFAISKLILMIFSIIVYFFKWPFKFDLATKRILEAHTHLSLHQRRRLMNGLPQQQQLSVHLKQHFSAARTFCTQSKQKFTTRSFTV